MKSILIVFSLSLALTFLGGCSSFSKTKEFARAKNNNVVRSVASDSVELKSTTRTRSISPATVTFYKGQSLSKTYVSTVAELIGGAWLTQEVFVSIGSPEEALETFSVKVVGEVVNVYTSESQKGDIGVTITTGTGPFNPDKGIFDDGYTKYHLAVKVNANTDHGYSSVGTLETTYFQQK